MVKVRIPVQTELVVEAETEEALQRWLHSFTYTDECTEDCLYSIRVMRGAVNADLWYDPVQVRAEVEQGALEPA